MPKLTWFQESSNPNIHLRYITTNKEHIVRLIDTNSLTDTTSGKRVIEKMVVGVDDDGVYRIPTVSIDTRFLTDTPLDTLKNNINNLISRFHKNPKTYVINLQKWTDEYSNAVSWEERISTPPKPKDTPNTNRVDISSDLVSILTDKLNILENKIDRLQITPTTINKRESESESESDDDWDIKAEMDNLLQSIKDFSGFDDPIDGTPELRVISVIEILKGLMNRTISYRDLDNVKRENKCLDVIPPFS